MEKVDNYLKRMVDFGLPVALLANSIIFSFHGDWSTGAKFLLSLATIPPLNLFANVAINTRSRNKNDKLDGFARFNYWALVGGVTFLCSFFSTMAAGEFFNK